MLIIITRVFFRKRSLELPKLFSFEVRLVVLFSMNDWMIACLGAKKIRHQVFQTGLGEVLLPLVPGYMIQIPFKGARQTFR